MREKRLGWERRGREHDGKPTAVRPLRCVPIVPSYETYSVQRKDREPLVEWMLEALTSAGCTILHASLPDRAPFRITFETPMGERLGILAYAFLANSKRTKNRPPDEHRFQVKYGSKDGLLHEVWQDPYELYTTLFFGINLTDDFFVAADPVLHSPTRFFISLEFKEHNAREILDTSWTSWERPKRTRSMDEPVEVLVGGRKKDFLRFVRFERAAKGLDPGHRQLLAEKMAQSSSLALPELAADATRRLRVEAPHAIAEELELSQAEILDLIQSAPRLKMAVRGWVAETHLERALRQVPGVEDCVRVEEEGGADIRLKYRGSRPLVVECKNVLRKPMADGTIRVDFQRTRASKEDPCSRFYAASDFDMVAACLHSCTESWEFRYAVTRELDPHKKCPGKLSNLVRLDGRWQAEVERVLQAVAAT